MFSNFVKVFCSITNRNFYIAHASITKRHLKEEFLENNGIIKLIKSTRPKNDLKPMIESIKKANKKESKPSVDKVKEKTKSDSNKETLKKNKKTDKVLENLLKGLNLNLDTVNSEVKKEKFSFGKLIISYIFSVK